MWLLQLFSLDRLSLHLGPDILYHTAFTALWLHRSTVRRRRFINFVFSSKHLSEAYQQFPMAKKKKKY